VPWLGQALADDLPTNLLLKCEGNSTFLLEGGGITPVHREEQFDTIVRLKDGVVSGNISVWVINPTPC
jgi:hypothetical protein